MIKVGISQCLLGAKVRFDGGHKQNRYCQNDLSKVFSFVQLCPEVGIGMPIPRKTIRLVGDADNPRAVFSAGGTEDFSEDLKNFADQNLEILSQLSGYIFCKASPSCGVQRVKVYRENGHSESNGTGIFAARVKQLFPNLPVEEDGRLNDPLLRDSFIKRVYIYNEWQQLNKSGLTSNKLYGFHSRHKMTLLAHCQTTYRKLGPLVASVTKENIIDVAESYIGLVMTALEKMATRSNNTNVLMHLQGYLKDHLSTEDRQELSECILEYNDGIQPILSPLTLLKHHLKHNPIPYVEQQSYLDPYPKSLAIRVNTL